MKGGYAVSCWAEKTALKAADAVIAVSQSTRRDIAVGRVRGADHAPERRRAVWIEQMLPKAEAIELISHATVFARPSIYEPLGIVNLEAMACEAAVAATATCGDRRADSGSL